MFACARLLGRSRARTRSLCSSPQKVATSLTFHPNVCSRCEGPPSWPSTPCGADVTAGYRDVEGCRDCRRCSFLDKVRVRRLQHLTHMAYDVNCLLVIVSWRTSSNAKPCISMSTYQLLARLLQRQPQEGFETGHCAHLLWSCLEVAAARRWVTGSRAGRPTRVPCRSPAFQAPRTAAVVREGRCDPQKGEKENQKSTMKGAA